MGWVWRVRSYLLRRYDWRYRVRTHILRRSGSFCFHSDDVKGGSRDWIPSTDRDIASFSEKAPGPRDKGDEWADDPAAWLPKPTHTSGWFATLVARAAIT